MREWRNRQTRTFEGRVVIPYGFKSRLSHQKEESQERLFFYFERVLNPRGSERKKQSGGLLLARSGEPGSVACDGRRAISMQGEAAADGKSRLSHQIKRVATAALFLF